VLGANDGLTSTASLIRGVAAAGAGKRFFPMFRFYGPAESFFDKRWKLEDLVDEVTSTTGGLKRVRLASAARLRLLLVDLTVRYAPGMTGICAFSPSPLTSGMTGLPSPIDAMERAPPGVYDACMEGWGRTQRRPGIDDADRAGKQRWRDVQAAEEETFYTLLKTRPTTKAGHRLRPASR
jgi:hypothetical protein